MSTLTGLMTRFRIKRKSGKFGPNSEFWEEIWSFVGDRQGVVNMSRLHESQELGIFFVLLILTRT